MNSKRGEKENLWIRRKEKKQIRKASELEEKTVGNELISLGGKINVVVINKDLVFDKIKHIYFPPPLWNHTAFDFMNISWKNVR